MQFTYYLPYVPSVRATASIGLMKMKTMSLVLLLALVASAHAAPCDIYAGAGTPCAAAHSMVRALFAHGSGPLYQLKRFHDNATLDIYPLARGGFADAASHDKFCAGAQSQLDPSYPPRADCVVSKLYDQTGNANDLLPAGPAVSNPAYDNPVNASRHPISAGGHKVYGAYFETGMGYRAQNTKGVAQGNDPETIYMVTSGTHLNNECCFE